MNEIYKRGSKFYNKTVKKIEEIKDLFVQSQGTIMVDLSHLDDPKKVGKLAFFCISRVVSIVQIGIVRKLIGKEGAIK